MVTIQSIDLIATDPEVRGGKPCVAGTGVRVIDIAMAQLFHQRTPDEISSEYDLSLAQVHAALAYYFAHKATLDDDIRRQVESARQGKGQQFADGPSLLSG